MAEVQFQPGEHVPGTVYRVVRHLATGGMGSVFDVEDVSVGKRYVLKTLHPQLISRRDLAKRMQAEARTLGKLQHPNIVDVVTAGVTNDERKLPFYVMERLNGQNLRVVLEKKHSLELTHCYRIAIDVLDALAHAHDNGVIHRDVKPENIFLHRNTNGVTTTKLLDFGIMRLLDRKMSLTQGKFIGTLRYAAPEQLLGEPLGPATDIYSLGLVLYEMICGRGPFDDVGDMYAVGAAHTQMAPPAPSSFVRVPVEVERLLLGALAKRPEDRPRDAFTLAADLRRQLRRDEASPRSTTAVNFLSAAPESQHASTDAFGQTTLLALAAPPASRPPTEFGTTVREAPAEAVLERAPRIDRRAETRASGPFGQTLPIPQNGTLIDEAGAAAAAARAAHPSSHPGGPSAPTGGPGPFEPEARKGRPARWALPAVVAALSLGALLVLGAVVFAKRPRAPQPADPPPPPSPPTAHAPLSPIVAPAFEPPAATMAAAAAVSGPPAATLVPVARASAARTVLSAAPRPKPPLRPDEVPFD